MTEKVSQASAENSWARRTLAEDAAFLEGLSQSLNEIFVYSGKHLPLTGHAVGRSDPPEPEPNRKQFRPERGIEWPTKR